MLKKEEGLADFTMSARELDCRVRGMSVWPNVYTYFNGKLVKIYKAKECKSEIGEASSLKPGEIFVTKKNLYVKF